jgi:predicted short-subunit dehydrogenase-like oxidoreductase (DUF2520 family)
MFDTITVIGAGGRAGSAIAGRLRERGFELPAAGGDLVLLCVPDAAIADVAGSIEPGPWLAHVSGTTPLAALHPHELRFSVHPLQTLVKGRGPEQLDGAFAGVTGESDEALERATWLAATLGLEPFPLDDGARTLYHAGAVIASNYLVTLYRVAAKLFADAGVPPEALVPLMRRTIENGFELTGPIARGDWDTVAAHLDALHEQRPELEPVYRVLAEATAA